MAFERTHPVFILLAAIGLIHALAGLNSADANGAELIRTLEGHTKQISAVAFMPDGKTVLSASYDQSVRQWDISTGKEVAQFRCSTVTNIVPTPDGKKLVLAAGAGNLYGSYVAVWDLGANKQIAKLKAPVKQLRVLPGSKRIVAGGSDGIARLWNIETGKEVRQFVAWRQGEEDGIPKGFARQAGTAHVATSPMAIHLATSSWRNKRIAVWDLQTGKQLRTWRNPSSEPHEIEFSPDGKYLLISTANGRNTGIQLWDFETGKLVNEWQCGYTFHVCFAPNGQRFVSSSTDGMIRAWDINQALPIAEFRGAKEWQCSIAISPDGNTVVSGGYDKLVKLWKLPK